MPPSVSAELVIGIETPVAYTVNGSAVNGLESTVVGSITRERIISAVIPVCEGAHVSPLSGER